MAGKNKGEISEILAVFCLLIDEKSKYIEFGNRLIIKLQNNEYNVYEKTKSKEKLLSKLNFDTIEQLKDELVNEIKIVDNSNGSYTYNVIDKITRLFNVHESQLNAPSKYNIDIIADGINYSVKSNFGSNPGYFNYSKKTRFVYKIENIDDKQMLKYKKDILSGVKSANNVLYELIYGKSCVIPDKYLYENKNGEKTFYNFLLKVDKKLPNVIMNIMYNKTKLQTNSLNKILNEEDAKIFKKFINLISQGLTVGNYEKFNIIEMKEIHFDKNLNYKITNCDNSYAEKVFSHLVVDRGSAKRTGFGTIYKENGDWYFVDDMYLRLR